MKFIKKPRTVEAIQFDDTTESIAEISNFTKGTLIVVDYKVSPPIVKIPTLGGTIYANVGDYIAKGIDGDFYPYSRKLFETNYQGIK